MNKKDVKEVDVYRLKKISTIATDCSTITMPVLMPGGFGSTSLKIIPITYRSFVSRDMEKYCKVPIKKVLFSDCGSITNIQKIPIRPDDPQFHYADHEYIANGYMAVEYNNVPEKLRYFLEDKKEISIKVGVDELSIMAFLRLKFHRWLKRWKKWKKN